MNPGRPAQLTRRVLLGGGVLLLAGCVSPDSPAARVSIDKGGFKGTRVENGYELPDVTLTDTAGKPYNLRTSPTTPIVVVFFGYTNCPDVCPGILADMASARRRMDDQALADKITLVMVTTDPARDTPEVIGTYLKRIDANFVGLSGPLETIVGAASKVGVSIEEGKKLPSGGYEVDHGTQIQAFDANRRLAVVWTTGTTVADLKADYTLLAGSAG